MTSLPLISIVVASYNHGDFIQKAIASVLEQDGQNWELLIADDASTDDTQAVLSQVDDPRIKTFFFDVNRQHHMRNFALDHARGEYIAILNSDDVYLPGKLAKQVDYLEAHPDTAAVFTQIKAIDDGDNVLPDHRLLAVFDKPNRPRHRWLEHFFHAGNCLCLPSAMIRRDALESVGRFDNALVQLSDYDLWIRLCMKWELWILPEVLTAIRVMPDRNLSAPSVSSANRSTLEHVRVMRHYLSATALAQTGEIFPEISELLPEQTDEWRRLLICNMACRMPRPAMRAFGFQHLQALIADDAARERLLIRNPRLMRNFILSAGTSAMRPEPGTATWTIRVLDADGMNSEKDTHRFCQDAGSQAMVFSVPAPKRRGCIQIDPPVDPPGRRVCEVRLYDQQSGQLIEQLGADRLEFRPNPGQFLLPSPDASSVSGKWLDLEIDVALA